MDLWPSLGAFAQDIGAEGTQRCKVYQWYRRNSIDLSHWLVVIAAAQRHGKGTFTLADLYAMWMRRWVANEPRPAGRHDRPEVAPAQDPDRLSVGVNPPSKADAHGVA